MNRISVAKVPVVLHVRKQQVAYADDIEYIYDIGYTVIPTRDALRNMSHFVEMAQTLQTMINYFVQVCPESFSRTHTNLTFLI